MPNFIANLKDALYKGFINQQQHQGSLYKPELLIKNSTFAQIN